MKIGLCSLILFLVGCTSTTPVVFGGARTTHTYDGDKLIAVTTERTPSILGVIFGETSPTPGEEAIRAGIAHQRHARAGVDESRGVLNSAVAAKLAAVESPEQIRALAELRSANSPDEGAVSAYSGGNRDGGNASAYVRSVFERFRRR